MTHRASIPVVRVSFEKEGGQAVEHTFEMPFTIGRAPECEVQVALKSVSRLHARVVFEGDQWRVQDAGSTNGLYVDGQKVQQVALSDSRTVRLGLNGPALHFRVANPEPEAWTPEPWKPEPPARAFFEPEGPAQAPFHDPPPPLSWPEPTAKAFFEPPPPVEVSPPEAPPRPEPVATTSLPDVIPAAPMPYRANSFTFSLNNGWTDKTLYILNGPVTDSFQHSITIQVEPEVSVDALLEYADIQMQALQAGLTECQLLKTDQIQLINGLPAYRAIFVWRPVENERLYQEQLYVLHRQTGYILTAAFTKKTRKTLGPQVEQVMVSFAPQE